MNSKIAEDVISAIENNELKLPTQPEVALRIRECSEDDNVNAVKLAKIINQDLGLTAKFMQMANSPLMRGLVPIESLPSAINRLGFKFVCDTATGLAMQQIFQATNDVIDKMMRATWESSGYVAACSLVFSKKFTRIPTENASLAGLMHQIGVLPILTYAQDHEELIQNEEELQKIIIEYHPQIGQAILKSWQFTDEISTLPTRIHETETSSDDEISLQDVIKLSILQAQQNGKYLYNIDSITPEIYDKFHLNAEELATDERFLADLDASVKIYCQHD